MSYDCVMKYELCIINQRGIVCDTIQFKTKKIAEKWIVSNILAFSLTGKSISLYAL